MADSISPWVLMRIMIPGGGQPAEAPPLLTRHEHMGTPSSIEPPFCTTISKVFLPERAYVCVRHSPASVADCRIDLSSQAFTGIAICQTMGARASCFLHSVRYNKWSSD